jgi:hypothetical protein
LFVSICDVKRLVVKIVEPDALPMVTRDADLLAAIKLSSDESFPRVAYMYSFEHEDHRHSPVPLAAFAARPCLASGSCIVSMGTTKVWASAQDDFLVSAALAKMFGAQASDFGDNCFILAVAGDHGALTSLFHLGMIFGWDINCYCKGVFPQLEIDHDGMLTFYFEKDAPGFSQSFFDATHRQLVRRA